MAINLEHDGLMIEVSDAAGNVVESSRGFTSAQLKRMHDEQRCGAFCGHCYQAGMDWLDAQEAARCESEFHVALEKGLVVK